MIARNKLKAVIVDDEYPARLMIRNLLQDHSETVEVTGEAKNGKEAIKIINAAMPDVVFLDITMPGMNGFEIVSKISCKPFIIFTTAYEQYAIKAFETNAVDYLVKPIDKRRFAQSIQRLQGFRMDNRQGIDLSRLENAFIELEKKRNKSTTIPVKVGDKIILLPIEKVSFLEAKEKYVYIHTQDGKEYLSDTRLGEFEDILPVNFLRVQKSIIVHKEKIMEIHKYFDNRLVITMNDKNRTRITTGGTYITLIRRSLGL
jgi:two-component system LytT family response regulator